LKKSALSIGAAHPPIQSSGFTLRHYIHDLLSALAAANALVHRGRSVGEQRAMHSPMKKVYLYVYTTAPGFPVENLGPI